MKEKLSDIDSQQLIIATQAIRQQAAGHAGGRFKLIERPEGYVQDFQDVYFPPITEPSLDIVETMGKVIMKQSEDGKYHFDRLRQAFREKPSTLEHAKQIMDAGDSLLLVINHRELIDIAMVMGALQCETGDPELIKGTRIFLGPIMRELALTDYDISAIAALQASTGGFIGFPDTDSTKKRLESEEIPAKLKYDTNLLVAQRFDEQMENREIKLVVMAPSGSTDDENEHSILMKYVSRGTAAMAKKYFKGLLPVAIVMDGDKTNFEVGDIVSLAGKHSIHDVMENNLVPMYSKITGKNVTYQRPPERKRRHRPIGKTVLGGSNPATT